MEQYTQTIGKNVYTVRGGDWIAGSEEKSLLEKIVELY